MQGIVKYISSTKKSVIVEVSTETEEGFILDRSGFIKHKDAGSLKVGQEVTIPDGLQLEERELIDEATSAVTRFKWWVQK